GIDTGYLPEDHGDVPLLPQDPPNGRPDLPHRQHRGRHLIEERLKDMVIVAVDENDARAGFSECLGRREAGKATADDEHTRKRPSQDALGAQGRMPPFQRNATAHAEPTPAGKARPMRVGPSAEPNAWRRSESRSQTSRRAVTSSSMTAL